MSEYEMSSGYEDTDVGAEETEVADQSDEYEVGAEDTEVADPYDDEEDESPSDAAFAEMRRKNEELERRIAEYDEALSYVFEGEGDERIVKAKAFGEGKTVEQVEAERELELLRDEYDRLEEELTNAEIERRMADDLETIKKIDPNVRSLLDLDPAFFDLIATGMVTAEQAYYATREMANQDRVETPEPVGEVNQSPAQKDYYTKDEVEAMSKEQVKKNYDAIRRSMNQW